ncbi:vanillin dehydrogenase [Sporothrix schenckii 1099-18]|uniref:Vanillin dehydrogenase n=1 Tax=Sporothrix schenckii 1099-18 TaxID=1397361 RepID=A0A0F2LZ82_SPOSC|nr:vanillin dehydrogenase [Sporothrix schenckii 1099-18]KJR82139.1 vanillin dehydrogenase [Sporothrix schenckii 1099-18]
MAIENVVPASSGGATTTTVPLLINGKEIVTPTVFPVVSPDVGTGSIWQASSASREDAVAAVNAARDAFPAWSLTKPAVRRTILLRAADLLEAHAAEYQACMVQETGSGVGFAEFNLMTSREIIRDCAGRISGALSGTAPICDDADTQALVVKEPYGVVLGIAPWNAPYILGIRSVVYALAAGNTCVLKGSEVSPRCFWAIGALFREAGLPDGCLNVLYHRPADAADVTRSLIEHPAVRKINFTGSTAVGRIISELAGRHLKPALMELGGKNNAIVCEDANVAYAAQQCCLGAFLHAGQICMSTERILVHKNVVDAFKVELKKAIAAIFSEAAPAQPLALPGGYDKVAGLVQDAVAKGAGVFHGQAPAAASSSTPSRTIHPIVLDGVTDQMDIYQTESFGPSVSLISVADDDEAVRIANDTDYGLSGAVFTEDLAKGLSIARRIETGAVHINSMSVHDEAGLPHGGVKNSGFGRFNADAGLNEFLKTKTITFRPSK